MNIVTDDNKYQNGLVPQGDSNKPTTPTTSIKIGLKTGAVGASVPLSLRARAAQAKTKQAERLVNETQSALTCINRIALMLDISGSMGSCANIGDPVQKIIHLQRAFAKFIESVDYSNTACAVRTFPFNGGQVVEPDWQSNPNGHGCSTYLSTSPLTLSACLLSLTAGGGTPMNEAMKYVLGNLSVTRGVLISDGEATDNHEGACIETAKLYREAGIPIDCMHIGGETSGELLLKQIAEITSGIYMKFTDVHAFSEALKYLTPKFRAMLTSGDSRQLAENAAKLGASEIKFLGGK